MSNKEINNAGKGLPLIKNECMKQLRPGIYYLPLCFPIVILLSDKSLYRCSNQSNINVNLLSFIEDSLVRLHDIISRCCSFHFISNVSLGDIADGEVSFVLSILGIREYKLLHRVY
jgi:hypothetical protein